MTRDEPDLDPHEEASGPGPDGIGPVRWHILAVIAVLGGLGAFLFVRLTEIARAGIPPELPWTLPMVLAIAAGGVAVLARTTYRRVHVERRWMAAHRGIRLLALGRTAVLAGTFTAGFGLVFALLFVAKAAVAVSLVRTVVGAALLVVGLGLLLAGRALERACHIPDDDSDPPRAPSQQVGRRPLR